jgi:hypothetical protein
MDESLCGAVDIRLSGGITNIMTRKQIKKQAARYLKLVEWSNEDDCFIGRCPELMLGSVHGNDEAKVYAEL